jgi:putative ABC transport system permease protein
MLRNYLKIALRNIWNNKVFSAINIMGLAIGMASCITILLFVHYERSYDGIHQRNIYRLDEVQKFEGMVAPQKVALSMFPMGPSLKADYPEVKNFVRIRPFRNVEFQFGEKKIEVKEGLWADSGFFQLFDFRLLEGDRAKVLEMPNTVVLSEKMAKNIFGESNPIGRTIVRYERDTLTFTVTGIVENVAPTSHLRFDALYSFKTNDRPENMQNWGSNWLVTYLELATGTDVAELEKKFPLFLKKHMKNDGWKNYELFLQPLSDVHAKSTEITHDYLNTQKFDRTYTYIFSVIAMIVLIIACVNFMNLSTARSMGRAREVGLRKAIGAQRMQLAVQFIGESILLSAMAMLLAIFLVKLILPYMADFSERDLQFALFGNFRVVLLILGGTLGIGVFSGLYPAAFLSAFEPIRVLKGTLRIGKSTFRSVLVVVQFTSAIFLMIATGFAVKQLRYMQDKDPGFDRSQVMIIPLNFYSKAKYDAIKDEFLASAFVESVTGSGQRLGNNLHQTGVTYRGEGPDKKIASSQVVVDPDYLSLYKIKIVAGRNFRNDPADLGKTYIVNESLAKELLKDQSDRNLSSVVGKRFGFSGMDSLGTIVGVAADFNFNSLHNKIETLCIFNQKDWGYSDMSVRIKGKDAKQAISALQTIWNKQLPGQTLNYTFLDDDFAQLYRADAQVSEIVGILAGLAIFVSCLGLFGLASYSAQRRVKEIGVRKVLGASVSGLVGLLSRDFMRLVAIAILIAIPVAWWAVNAWLKDFAYRIDVGWGIFVLASFLAIAIAMLTISIQSIKAALINPVKSLRSE